MPRQRPPHRVRSLLVTALCATALGLAACGDDDEEEATTPTTDAATTTTEAEATETTDVSDTREQFNEQLRQVLITQNDLTESQADCAIDQLNETISDEQIEEANTSGAPSQEVLDAAFQAGVDCADE